MYIKIDNDINIGYEKNSLLKLIIKHPIVFILNNIPPRLRNLIKKSNRSAKKIIEEATTHGAIETLYKFGEPEHANTFLQKFFHYIWFTTDNPKAVRNRLRLVTRELKNAIKEHLLQNKNIKILSIAAGSARAIFDAISLDELKSEKIVNVTFLDKNPKANEYSQRLSAERNYPKNYKFQWVVDTAGNFPNYLKDNDSPNIVEIVGLLDYFNNEAIEKLARLIYKNLEPGGIFITSNIVDNSERKFITEVVGWDMIYKKPEEFFEIAKKVGFLPENIKILYEPFKIHFVMIARK